LAIWNFEAEDEGASFQSEEQISAAITESWNEFTFEDIQRVFYNWVERLIWVIANSGKYYQS
jgi:hypothetical protein